MVVCCGGARCVLFRRSGANWLGEMLLEEQPTKQEEIKKNGMKLVSESDEQQLFIYVRKRSQKNVQVWFDLLALEASLAYHNLYLVVMNTAHHIDYSALVLLVALLLLQG